MLPVASVHIWVSSYAESEITVSLIPHAPPSLKYILPATESWSEPGNKTTHDHSVLNVNQRPVCLYSNKKQ